MMYHHILTCEWPKRGEKNGKLRIALNVDETTSPTVRAEMLEELRECRDRRGIDDALWEGLEYEIGNGLEVLHGEDLVKLGAMTSSMIFSDSTIRSDDGDFLCCYRLAWNPRYAVQDEIEEICEKGYVKYDVVEYELDDWCFDERPNRCCACGNRESYGDPPLVEVAPYGWKCPGCEAIHLLRNAPHVRVEYLDEEGRKDAVLLPLYRIDAARATLVEDRLPEHCAVEEVFEEKTKLDRSSIRKIERCVRDMHGEPIDPAQLRVGTVHEEFPTSGGEIDCRTCGRVDAAANPYYHSDYNAERTS